MSFTRNPSAWWGPPRKFNPKVEERKISWLELFYDLVYVIAISRITHSLSENFTINQFIEYCFLFALIFWGWINGSLYHDLHGNSGLRTRLMTLWQMMIIAYLAATIQHHQNEFFSTQTTIAFMMMQLFITYLWWSVGVYDKAHRKYNLPYTVLFLISLGLMGLCLYLPASYHLPILLLAIILNYTPPFLANTLLRKESLDLSLSSSMTERLGLLAIIVFGEVVLGVVNGISSIQLTGEQLIGFALALTIVFAIWWIFFTLISNRDAKSGFNNASLLELLYVPTLISLGLIASCFNRLFTAPTCNLTFALAAFLLCISVMMGMLVYPPIINPIKKQIRTSLLLTAGLICVAGITLTNLEYTYYLGAILCLLIAEIYYLNSLYYNLTNNKESA